MIVVMVFISAFFGVQILAADLELFVAVLMAIILFIVASFTWLQVAIDGNDLRIKFGYGVYRKSFNLLEIESAQAVRNKWYNGWGIRFWPKPPTWIYNVSGFDAVEIVMKNGKRYRIGTDEPEKLEQAIQQTIKL